MWPGQCPHLYQRIQTALLSYLENRLITLQATIALTVSQLPVWWIATGSSIYGSYIFGVNEFWSLSLSLAMSTVLGNLDKSVTGFVRLSVSWARTSSFLWLFWTFCCHYILDRIFSRALQHRFHPTEWFLNNIWKNKQITQEEVSQLCSVDAKESLAFIPLSSPLTHRVAPERGSWGAQLENHCTIHDKPHVSFLVNRMSLKLRGRVGLGLALVWFCMAGGGGDHRPGRERA